MSIQQCIPGLLAQGRITPAQAQTMTDLFGQYQSRFAQQMGPAAADAAASQATLQALQRAAALRRRRTLLQVQAQRQAWVDMQSYGTGAGGLRVLDADKPGHLGRAAEALLARSEFAPYRNVEYQAHAVRGQALATMNGILERHSRNAVGQIRDPAGLRDIVRELFDETSGNGHARDLADAWRRTSEGLRRRFNAAGGDIPRLADWGLPHSHDAQAVADAGFNAWRDATMPRLDRDRMVDRATGAPLNDGELEALLRDMHATIASDGWNKRAPGTPGSGGSLANRYADHRELHFASADDWLAYAEEFGGKGTPFDVMVGHVEMMSREIAAMEVLGPNPAQTVKWLGDAIEKQAALHGGAAHREAAFRSRRQVERLFDEVLGNNRRPENSRMAIGFGVLRSWQVATKLGSAVLSTFSDQATGALARRFNGLGVWQGVRTQLRMLNPADGSDRAFARRALGIAEGATQIGAAQARLTGEELTGEVARRMAELTLRVSGLNAVTEAGRWAFGMDFLSVLTRHAGDSYEALPGPMRQAMDRHGIGPAQWNRIRATPQVEERGASWILPDEINHAPSRDALRRMIFGEMDLAVPVATLRTKAAFNAIAPRGTVQGELMRTMLQFKAFPITLMWQQMGRTMAQTPFNAAIYAAQMLIFTTVAGAVALELKEIAKGRDPRPMIDTDDATKTAQFWGAAILQGGGLGIAGDFLKSATNRFGMDVGGTLAGPAFQTVNSLGNLAVTQPVKALTTDGRTGKPNIGGALVKTLRSETPGGSLWYARLGFERIVLDTLSEMIDPNYRDSWDRMERYAEEQDQDYFWAPGEGFQTARAPDVGRLAIGPDD